MKSAVNNCFTALKKGRGFPNLDNVSIQGNRKAGLIPIRALLNRFGLNQAKVLPGLSLVFYLQFVVLDHAVNGGFTDVELFSNEQYVSVVFVEEVLNDLDRIIFQGLFLHQEIGQ